MSSSDLSAQPNFPTPFQTMADEFDDLHDFGRKPTLSRRLIYLGLSFECVIVVAILFIRIFVVDLQASLVTLILAMILNTVLLSLAYHNLSFAKAARIRNAATPPTKSAYRGNKEDHQKALLNFDTKISQSALWYSCAYNNAIFMLVTPLLGKYLLSEKLSGDLNLLVSGAMAAGLAVFNSNTALKAIGETQ